MANPIQLTDAELRAVIMALRHVWKEVFDRETELGDGALIRSAIEKLERAD